jgi:hypothetical protein
LPLEVTDVVGVRVVVVGVLVVVDVRVVVRDGLVVVVRGADVLVDGVVAVPAGTSVNVGWAAVSRFASWMSLLSEVSCASVSSFLTEHALATTASESASVAPKRGIY